ncbi:MAG: exonuclease SbcCD subunit D C-terminal domain-containing protein, partial [Sutterellaceae bacterium]|nr:exonuclease SbcCD subunit D C-terminal domain-containing protein [Sutterellaceae bacterium]
PQAAVLAVPYLRERDVRVSHEHETQSDKEALIVEGTREHYTKVLEAALDELKTLDVDNLPIIATGHLFAAKCAAGDDERNLYVGSLGQIPADVFDERIDYVALGHLHRPQVVGGNPTRRYSGSPLALDFSENHAKKSVLLVDFDGKTPCVTEVPVPAFDRLERVSGTAEEILQKLSALVAENDPLYCEITHSQGAFAPQLAQDCRDIAQGSKVQIVRVVSRAMIDARITSEDQITDVDALTPEEMFELRLSKEVDLDDDAKTLLRNAHAEILHSYYNPETDQTLEKKE